MSNCKRCEGNGNVECQECNGKGQWGVDPYIPCLYCGGTGMAYCPDCMGTGYLDDLAQDEINQAHDAWRKN